MLQCRQFTYVKLIVLAANSLACERGERLLFTQLNFTLHPGEVIQITGPNGAGKSSLLKILAGLANPLSGSITWEKQTIDKVNYASSMCYLGHHNGLKASLTAAENLYFSQQLMIHNEISIAEALTRVNLANYADTLIEQLSAGQQRRVALARLLTSSAQLWILDEPFTSLDKGSMRLIETLIDNHCAKEGMAIIATHQMLTLSKPTLKYCELSS